MLKSTLTILCVLLCTLALIEGDDFSKIDAHAKEAPTKATCSISSLSDYLAKEAKSDTEKARTIFSWITHNIAYDTKAYFSGRYGDLSAEGVLRSRASVCSGYAALFKSLADAMGLEAVVIHGFAKGYGYTPSDGVPEEWNHAWNAVKINGAWKLIDATWGAGYLRSREEGFVRQVQPFYFFTEAKNFIYDHYPKETRWQLLDSPISKEAYFSLLSFEPEFYALGFRPENVSHKNARLSAGARIRIRLSSLGDVKVMATLSTVSRKGKTLRTREIPNACFVRKTQKGYSIDTVFKEKGEYMLRVFGRPKKRSKGAYDELFSYFIKAEGGSTTAGFPSAYGSYRKMNADIQTPLNGTLKIGSTQLFKLSLENAEEVTIIQGSKWTPLQGKNGVFQGEVKISSQKIIVAAKPQSGKGYIYLLAYEGVK